MVDSPLWSQCSEWRQSAGKTVKKKSLSSQSRKRRPKLSTNESINKSKAAGSKKSTASEKAEGPSKAAKTSADSNKNSQDKAGSAEVQSKADVSEKASNTSHSAKSVTGNDEKVENPEVVKCTCRPRKRRHRKDYYYLVLGLTRHAATEHIELAYQTEINRIRIIQAKQNGSLSQEQKDRLAEINFAYSILAHTQRKKIYDTYGLRGVLLGRKHPTLHHSLWMIATRAWKFGIHVLTYLTCFWCGCCCFCGCCCVFCCRCCCGGCCGYMKDDRVCEVHQGQFEDYTIDGKTITQVKDGAKSRKRQTSSESQTRMTRSSRYRARRHSAPGPGGKAHGSNGFQDRARLFIDQPAYSVKHTQTFKPAEETAKDAAEILKKYKRPGSQQGLPELNMKEKAGANTKLATRGSVSKKYSTSGKISGTKKSLSSPGTKENRSGASLKPQSTLQSTGSSLASGITAGSGSSTIGTSSCTSSDCQQPKTRSKHKKPVLKHEHKRK